MIKPRCGHGLIAHGGYLYAIGGWVGLDIGQTVERYDFESGVWNMHDKTATPRFAFGAMEYEGNQKPNRNVRIIVFIITMFSIQKFTITKDEGGLLLI